MTASLRTYLIVCFMTVRTFILYISENVGLSGGCEELGKE